MHISTANILEIVKDMANITIFIKYEDACKDFRLAHERLTLTDNVKVKVMNISTTNLLEFVKGMKKH